MGKVIYAIYFMFIIVFGLLAYDLFNSKKDCEDAILDWTAAKLRGYSDEVINQLKSEAKSQCSELEIKAKIYAGE